MGGNGLRYRALVVDDSAFYRNLVAEILLDTVLVDIVDKAPNGKEALKLIEQYKPDIMILDLNMPELDGKSLIRILKKRGIEVGIIVLSSVDIQGSKETLQALEEGAFDFIPKPGEADFEVNLNILQRALKKCIESYKTAHPPVEEVFPYKNDLATGFNGNFRPELILMVLSTGGPLALSKLLPQLPENFSCPILIVQHLFDPVLDFLSETLDKKSKIRVVKVVNKEIIIPGKAYLAPAGQQMQLVSAEKGKYMLLLTDDPPEEGLQPSANYLFRSVARNFLGKTMVCIMTGMGRDGIAGVKLLKHRGCFCMVQDQNSSTVFGMALEALRAGVADGISSIDNMAAEMVKAVNQSSKSVIN